MKPELKRSCLLMGIIALTALAAACYGPEAKKIWYYEKGLQLSTAGDTVRARLEFKNALQIDPNFFQAYYELGRIELQEHDYKKAYKYLSKAVEIAPEHYPSHLQLGKLFYTGNAIDRAREITQPHAQTGRLGGLEEGLQRRTGETHRLGGL